MEKRYTRKVYYYETDRMGIVHHSNYIRWFEEARIFFFNSINQSYNDMENMGLWLPVLSSCCNYKSFLKYDETFFISVKLSEYNGCKLKLVYIVYNEKGNISADGYTLHCFTTPEMKPLRINKKYPEIHQKFIRLLDNKE